MFVCELLRSFYKSEVKKEMNNMRAGLYKEGGV